MSRWRWIGWVEVVGTISVLPAGGVGALMDDVSEESNQSSMPAFGKKKAVKQSGGGLLMLGLAGVAACLLAAAMVMMNMA
jgi:hypothetical protein